ncbi:hypothetical protein [Melaminivora sp.]|uniref:hypothetical protein n=1 Tax=Melaminivora sp. TaxID=1933032 RepID=UPI0028ACC2F2|nr:hypothetical protein [Melaminivora sp.]
MSGHAPQRARGWRAVIEFAPKPTSPERIIAGVVVRTEDGHVQSLCAVDERKAQHAYGHSGKALHAVAQQLCMSLASHWQATPDTQSWRPPFAHARLAHVSRFSAATALEGLQLMLARTSTLYTLFSAYELEQQVRSQGIVERVRALVRKDPNAKHLARRFGRELNVHGEAQPMRVDFLGQHYACYFLQITHSARGIEASTDRAYGKLYELQALRRLVKKPRKGLGLLDEERPDTFELLMIGNTSDAVQRRAIKQVEALADRGEVLARVEPSAVAAAQRVSALERRAA